MFKKHLLHLAGTTLLFLVGTLTALLMAEYALKYRLIIRAPITQEGHFDFHEQFRLSTLKRGEPYDERTLVEVITSERAQHERVFPAASPAYFLAESGSSVIVDGQPVLPLGITALADNYYCNESGQYAKFVTDQYGFRNKKSAWTEQPEIVAIGDSFTMGSCLDYELSVVGQIQKTGKKILNLGMGSNGPLIELASLIEFGLRAKPKIILWNFFPNDLDDLLHEQNNPILTQYLIKGFSQNLKEHAERINPAVDLVIEDYMKQLEMKEKSKPAPPSDNPFYFTHIQKVYRYLKNQAAVPQPNYEDAVKLLLRTLSQAAQETKKINAQIFFVYIPDCNDNSYRQQEWRSGLLASVKQLGIPVIDLKPAIAELEKSDGSAYFSCPGSHFNSAGAKIAAEHIVKEMKKKPLVLDD